MALRTGTDHPSFLYDRFPTFLYGHHLRGVGVILCVNGVASHLMREVCGRGAFMRIRVTALTLRGDTMKQGVSWRKIKAEYIAGGISQQGLADKYGVPFGTLQKRARVEKWTEKRKRADEKAAEKVSEKTAEIVSDNAVLLEKVKTGLLQKLAQMVEAYPDTNAAEIKHRTKNTEIIYRMKDIAAIYAALEDKSSKGQSADIEDLSPLADLLNE